MILFRSILAINTESTNKTKNKVPLVVDKQIVNMSTFPIFALPFYHDRLNEVTLERLVFNLLEFVDDDFARCESIFDNRQEAIRPCNIVGHIVAREAFRQLDNSVSVFRLFGLHIF